MIKSYTSKRRRETQWDVLEGISTEFPSKRRKLDTSLITSIQPLSLDIAASCDSADFLLKEVKDEKEENKEETINSFLPTTSTYQEAAIVTSRTVEATAETMGLIVNGLHSLPVQRTAVQVALVDLAADVTVTQEFRLHLPHLLKMGEFSRPERCQLPLPLPAPPSPETKPVVKPPMHFIYRPMSSSASPADISSWRPYDASSRYTYPPVYSPRSPTRVESNSNSDSTKPSLPTPHQYGYRIAMPTFSFRFPIDQKDPATVYQIDVEVDQVDNTKATEEGEILPEAETPSSLSPVPRKISSKVVSLDRQGRTAAFQDRFIDESNRDVEAVALPDQVVLELGSLFVQDFVQLVPTSSTSTSTSTSASTQPTVRSSNWEKSEEEDCEYELQTSSVLSVKVTVRYVAELQLWPSVANLPQDLVLQEEGVTKELLEQVEKNERVIFRLPYSLASCFCQRPNTAEVNEKETPVPAFSLDMRIEMPSAIRCIESPSHGESIQWESCLVQHSNPQSLSVSACQSQGQLLPPFDISSLLADVELGLAFAASTTATSSSVPFLTGKDDQEHGIAVLSLKQQDCPVLLRDFALWIGLERPYQHRAWVVPDPNPLKLPAPLDPTGVIPDFPQLHPLAMAVNLFPGFSNDTQLSDSLEEKPLQIDSLPSAPAPAPAPTPTPTPDSGSAISGGSVIHRIEKEIYIVSAKERPCQGKNDLLSILCSALCHLTGIQSKAGPMTESLLDPLISPALDCSAIQPDKVAVNLMAYGTSVDKFFSQPVPLSQQVMDMIIEGSSTFGKWDPYLPSYDPSKCLQEILQSPPFYRSSSRFIFLILKAPFNQKQYASIQHLMRQARGHTHLGILLPQSILGNVRSLMAPEDQQIISLHCVEDLENLVKTLFIVFQPTINTLQLSYYHTVQQQNAKETHRRLLICPPDYAACYGNSNPLHRSSSGSSCSSSSGWGNSDSAIPEKFLCLITMSLMEEPVVTACGHVFDKTAIQSWLLQRSSCPYCRANLSFGSQPPALHPCFPIKNEIRAWKAEFLAQNQASLCPPSSSVRNRDIMGNQAAAQVYQTPFRPGLTRQGDICQVYSLHQPQYGSVMPDTVRANYFVEGNPVAYQASVPIFQSLLLQGIIPGNKGKWSLATQGLLHRLTLKGLAREYAQGIGIWREAFSYRQEELEEGGVSIAQFVQADIQTLSTAYGILASPFTQLSLTIPNCLFKFSPASASSTSTAAAAATSSSSSDVVQKEAPAYMHATFPAYQPTSPTYASTRLPSASARSLLDMAREHLRRSPSPRIRRRSPSRSPEYRIPRRDGSRSRRRPSRSPSRSPRRRRSPSPRIRRGWSATRSPSPSRSPRRSPYRSPVRRRWRSPSRSPSRSRRDRRSPSPRSRSPPRTRSPRSPSRSPRRRSPSRSPVRRYRDRSLG